MEYLRPGRATATRALLKVAILTFHCEQSLTNHSAARPTSPYIPPTRSAPYFPIPSHLAMSGKCTFLLSVGKFTMPCPCPNGELDPLDPDKCDLCKHLLSEHENVEAPPTGQLQRKLHFAFKTVSSLGPL